MELSRILSVPEASDAAGIPVDVSNQLFLGALALYIANGTEIDFSHDGWHFNIQTEWRKIAIEFVTKFEFTACVDDGKVKSKTITLFIDIDGLDQMERKRLHIEKLPIIVTNPVIVSTLHH